MYSSAVPGDDDILKTLQDAGFTAIGSRIKLAHGVVGKTSAVALAAFTVLGVVAFGLKGTDWLPAIAFAVVVMFLAFFFVVIDFAKKNPGAALLEGAELVQWRRLEMGAKDLPIIPNMPNAGSGKMIEPPE